MFRSRSSATLMAIAGLVALGVAVGAPAPKRRADPKLTIDPPQRYRDTRIKGSYDDNVAPRPVRDSEAISAADAKRARKAAKRLREQQP